MSWVNRYTIEFIKFRWREYFSVLLGNDITDRSGEVLNNNTSESGEKDEMPLDTHHLFIDFKQTCDSIVRYRLYLAMDQLGIPRKLLLCQMTKIAVLVSKKASLLQQKVFDKELLYLVTCLTSVWYS
ncbi:hypothetical protein ACFFRR_006063 [Megaselia abdita]